jgi:hypothetical protein
MEENYDLRNISEASDHEISTEMFNLCNQNYFTVFPVGFRAAGKTMLMSSIFSFAEKHATKPFKVTPHRHYPFNASFKVRAKMVEDFDIKHGQLMGRTAVGNLDLFGLNLEPKHPKLKPLKLNFVDVSGEDIAKIKTTDDAQLTKKLKAVFHALELSDSPCVFMLVTPYSSSEQKGDSAEDTLHANFIDFLVTEYPKLYSLSRIFIVVTKWDQNIDSKFTPEMFIKQRRSSLYGKISGTKAAYGAYSIGKVLETRDGDEVMAKLVEINNEYPYRLWKKLYETFSGESLEYKSWWQKLFS